MNKILIIIVFTATFTKITAQIDTTLRDYFPLEVGNYWEYRDHFANLWKIEAIKDSTMPNGKNYVVFKDSTDWIGGGIYYYYYRIDDSMRVWEYVDNNPGSCDKEYLSFDLTLPDSTIWTTCAPTNHPDPENNFPCIAGTENIYYPAINLLTTSKTFCGAVVDTMSQDTIICGSFYFPVYELAKGIGIGNRWAESGNEIFITGAIIRGVQYGTIVSVEYENQMNNYGISFDVYPNPFNIETILKFSLESPSEVVIKLYDILGNEIGTIFKDFLSAGKYEKRFNSSELSSGNLASGIYLVTMFTDKQPNTKKVILLK
jgi:hypothetical protein